MLFFTVKEPAAAYSVEKSLWKKMTEKIWIKVPSEVAALPWRCDLAGSDGIQIRSKIQTEMAI